MNSLVNLKLDFLLSTLLTGLIIVFQLPHLNLGHYWDEAWVYAPAVRAMASGVPSLLPDAISVDLSRGHPLLFQFIGGVWAKVFGISNASLHCFALSISVSLLLLIQHGLKKLIGVWPAFLAALMVATSPMFLAQSAMVYPEMLMTVGFVLALISYTAGNRLFFSIGLAVALLSKESALVFVIGFALLDLARLVFDKRPLRWFSAYTLPVLVIVLHPLSLYLTYGWFLYPDHTGYVRFDINDIRYFTQYIAEFTLEGQGRGWILYIAIVLAAVSVRLKHIAFNGALILIGWLGHFVLFWEGEISNYLYLFLIGLGITLPIFIWWFTRRNEPRISCVDAFLLLSYILTIGFIVFSAMNFFTNRYMLSIVILLHITTAIILFRLIRIPEILKYLIAVIAVGVNLFVGLDKSEIGENNIGLFNDLRITQNLTNWMHENASAEDLICADFVITNYLTNPGSGYVTEENDFERWFEKMCHDCDSAKFIIASYTNDCNDRVNEEVNAGHRLVYTDTIESSWISVYENANRSQ